MKILCAFVILLSFSILSGYSQCTSCNTTVSSSNGTSRSVANKKSLCFTGGTYSGSITSVASNGTICVGSNATFSPSSLDNFSGTINVYGTANLPAVNFSSGVVINNYGTTNFKEGTNFNGKTTITNHPNGTLTFSNAVSMNRRSTITNNGTIVFKNSLSVSSKNTFTNNNIARVTSSISSNGNFTNSGLLVSKSSLSVDGGTFINNCRLVVSSFTNTGSATSNNGLIWAAESSSNVEFNGGTFTQSSNGEVRGVNFTNSGTVKGSGRYYFSGTTTNSNSFGNDGNGINFYDVNVSGSKKFDNQNTNPHSSVVRTAFTPSDTTGSAPATCSSSYCTDLEANAGVNQTRCNGSTTFSMSANTVSGATGAWTLASGNGSISNSSSATTNVTVAVGKSATFRWTLTNSCSSSNSTVTITNNNAPSASISGNSTICSGGSETLTASGDGTYLWSTGDTTASISVSTAKTYTVTVTNASGCTATASKILTSKSAPSASISGNSTICSGGSETLTASGGDTYLWSTGATTASISVSTAKTYTVTVTNASGCTATASKTLAVSPPMNIASSASNSTCNLCDDGAISLSVSGGTSPYTYRWNDGNTSKNRIGLAAAVYSVTVKDNLGCTAKINDTVYLPLAANIASLSACNIASGGAAQANAIGGRAPYTYRWNTGETSQNISNLQSGNYKVTVTDALGNTAVQTVSISNTMVNITFDPPAPIICKGSSVQIMADGALSYSWSPSMGVSATNIADPMLNPTNTTTYTVSTIASTNDLVTNGGFELGNTGFTSAYGFVSAAENNAADGKGLYPEGRYAIDTKAQDYHSNFTGSGNSGSGKFMIINGAVTAGQAVWRQTILVQPNTTYNFSTFISSVNEDNPANLRFQINGVVLGPNIVPSTTRGRWSKFTATWRSSSNNSAEIAIINDNTIAGGNDFGLDDISFTSTCISSSELTVTVNKLPLVSFNKTDVSCNGETDGIITAAASGTVAPYSYRWKDGSTDASVNHLASGTYIVTVKDKNNCSVTDSAFISQPNILSVVVSKSDATCMGLENGSAQLTVNGGTAPYSYNWSNGASTKNISGIAAGKYFVTVHDAHDCLVIDSVTITEPITPPPFANAGDDTTRAGGSSVFKMNANAPGIGASGMWTLISGNAIVTSPVSNTSEVNVAMGEEVSLEWKIVSGGCEARDTVKIKHEFPYAACFAVNSGEWNLSSTWSGNCTGANGYPGINDTAIISGKTISVSGNSFCKLLVMYDEQDAAKLNIQSSGALSVADDIEMNAPAQNRVVINLSGYGKLYLGGTVKRNTAPFNYGKIASSSNSTIYFNGNKKQIIPSSNGGGNDGIAYQNVVFNNTSGLSPAFVAEGKIEINNSLTLTKGCLDMGRDTILLTNNSNTAAKGGNDSSFIMGQFCRYIGENGKTYRWSVGRKGQEGEYWFELKNNLLVGTSYICVEFDSVPEDSKLGISFRDEDLDLNNLSPEGIWRVEPNAQPTLGSYDVKVSTQHFSGLIDDQFSLLKRPTHSTALSWSNGDGLLPALGNSLRLVASSMTSLSSLTSFSEFGIGNGAVGSLPVKLTKFEAKPVENKYIRLDWSTEVEIDNMGFEIHRSTDGANFEKIGWVDGNGTSTETNVYQYNDDKVVANQPYYYRLKQIDFDGDFEYSPIATADIKGKEGNIKVGDFIPNPAKNSVSLSISCNTDLNFNFTFVDILGKVAKSGSVSVKKGEHVYYFDITELTHGNYIASITAGRENFSRKLVVY